MFKFLLRAVFFFGGVAMLLDAGLPAVTETVHVDGHSNVQQVARNNEPPSSNYTLQLIGGRTTSISVGYQAYKSLNDGDAVTVKTSKIIRRCLKIEKDGVEIYANKYWKIFSIIAGVLMIASALGWGNNDEEGSSLPNFD